jgi:hypothetical protein
MCKRDLRSSGMLCCIISQNSQYYINDLYDFKPYLQHISGTVQNLPSKEGYIEEV